MLMASGLTNMQRSWTYRAELALWLAAQGFRELTPVYERPSDLPSEQLRQPQGHLVGLDGWTLSVSNRVTVKLAEQMDEAATASRLDGNDKFALIQKRQGVGLENSYVLMPLHVFVNVLRELYPEVVTQGGRLA
jgi:hypothetical protein